MTQEEKDLLLKDLCARLPYEVIVKFEVDTSYDTCFDSIWQTSYFDGILLSINSDSEEVELLTISDDEDLLIYLHDQLNAQPVEYTECQPYLRPISSLTQEERDKFCNIGGIISHRPSDGRLYLVAYSPEALDYLNSIHADYRDMIEKGLAIEAPEGMYNKKE